MDVVGSRTRGGPMRGNALRRAAQQGGAATLPERCLKAQAEGTRAWMRSALVDRKISTYRLPMFLRHSDAGQALALPDGRASCETARAVYGEQHTAQPPPGHVAESAVLRAALAVLLEGLGDVLRRFELNEDLKRARSGCASALALRVRCDRNLAGRLVPRVVDEKDAAIWNLQPLEELADILTLRPTHRASEASRVAA